MSGINRKPHNRKDGIGASESPAVLGVDPFRGPIDVYNAKTSEEEVPADQDEPESQVQRHGHLFEQALADWYSEDTGRKLRRVRTVRRNAKIEHLFATPDREVVGDSGLVEIKTTQNRSRWLNDEGKLNLPMNHRIQGLHQLAVTGKAWVDFTVLFFGVWNPDERIALIRLERDDQAIEMLVDVLGAFWRDHVEARVPPPVDGSPAYTRYIAKRYPQSEEVQLASTADLDLRVEQLREVRSKLATLEREEFAIENRIKAWMGDAAVVQGPDYRITWRTGKPIEHVDWQLYAESIEALIPEHERARMGGMKELYSMLKSGKRPFIVRDIK